MLYFVSVNKQQDMNIVFLYCWCHWKR